MLKFRSAGLGWLEEGGEPHGARRGAGDAVTTASRDQEGIARFELGMGAVGVFERGAAGEKQHPFVFGLLVPEARRARLAVGDDAFQPQAGAFEELGEVLLGAGFGQVLEKIQNNRTGLLAQLGEQAVELIEARELDVEAPNALLVRLDLHARAEAVGEFLFEA